MFEEEWLKLSQHAGTTRHHPILRRECCRQWWYCWPGRIQNKHNQQATMGLNQQNEDMHSSYKDLCMYVINRFKYMYLIHAM